MNSDCSTGLLNSALISNQGIEILFKGDMSDVLHSICPTVHLSYIPFVLLPICPTVHLSYCPIVLLSICPTVQLSYYPFVLLSNCPTVHFYCPIVLQSICPTVHLSYSGTGYRFSYRVRYRYGLRTDFVPGTDFRTEYLSGTVSVPISY